MMMSRLQAQPVAHARQVSLAMNRQEIIGPNLGYDHGGRLLTAWLDR
jgi:hypothetical protein